MRSDDTARALTVIAENIALARQFVGSLDYEVFAGDEKTIYAVTRCLEIISEASRRLPEPLKARHPDVPWTNIAGAGNIYRHDYEDVLPRLLWNTVQHHLAPLEAVIIVERR